ncbi:hypothetical protein RhiirA1_542517 [Rhizophagus irregularis]|uniref:Crinkler effector protein N-terminal domain-containing protein n=1 Tax=Rhizophagus irregularis TaxID=588596 RepID=A0A2N0QWM8_9GLOM|nr:hypothetical protein RhiirA1_542517 [Rhizophagus irregularis]
MSITLLCLVKGNTTASAFAVDIDREKLVSHLKDAIKEKKQNDFAGIDADRLKLWKTTTKAVGDPPASVQLWGDFFEQVNSFHFDQQPRFERPRFVMKEVVDEEDVRSVLDFNICQILNKLMGPDCVYSRRPTDTPGIPDFNCHLIGSLILVMEAKRKHVLEDMGEQTFPEFYNTSKGKDVIQQIYNYMGGNELRYGILTTYDNHWFLCREHTKLWISKTLSLESESPPVLKAYAYLT